MSTTDEFATYVPKLGDQRLLSDKHFDGISIETLALFDHDYEGIHAHIQYWDHREPSEQQVWRYGLLGSYSQNGWTFRMVHEWGEHMPSFTEVGERIDQYMLAPPALRILLR